VLWNLLTNAVKFTPQGGRVQVVLERVSSHVEITVMDSGVGIKPEFLPYVFDRFRQADASTTRRFGGLGLGLSIARQLTELHGGSLMAESEGRNRGATFTVRLPVVPGLGPAPLIAAASASAPPAAGPPSLGGARVLLVDDQPDVCAQVERILRDRAADVTTAPDVTQAAACLDEQHFDVVVSDVHMLQRDGYGLLRHVRERHGRLPVLGMTSASRREEGDRLLAVGFDRHLPKPVSADRLVRVVAELVQQGTAARVEGPR
jgi:CheY-like chemotaxis protein